MAPAQQAALLRWSDEEHDILVQMTNDQIQLEYEDASRTISWAKHWKQVSLCLKEHSYNRTPIACQMYWKRSFESQKATELAAGPRWDDSEHQILVGMTEDQLELEKSDPSSIISWPQHWQKVSLCLQDNGYFRTADACSAYWILAESNIAVGVGNGTDADGQSLEGNAGLDSEGEDYIATTLGDKSTQKSTKATFWTETEHENLSRLVKANQVDEESLNGLEVSSALKSWSVISEQHHRSGFDRTWQDCKKYWQNLGRFKEHQKSSAQAEADRKSTESTELNPSSLIPSDEVQNINMVSENNVRPRSSREMSQSGMQGRQNAVVAPDLSQLPSLINTIASDPDASTHEFSREPEQESKVKLRHPTQPLSLYETKAWEQPKEKAFRFKPHQKLYLEGEAVRNGPSPDATTIKQIAMILGVEDKTIRNWFVHYRHAKRIQASPATKGASMSVSPKNINGSNSSKRPLVSPSTEQNPRMDNSPSLAVSGNDGLLPPVKKVRVGNLIHEDAVHNINTIASDRTSQASPRESSGVPVNILHSTSQVAHSTDPGHGQENISMCNISIQTRLAPHDSQVIDGSKVLPISSNTPGGGSELVEQPTSAFNPLTSVDRRPLVARMTSSREDNATSNHEATRENSSSQIHPQMNSPSRGNIPGSLQPASTHASTPSTSTPTTEEQAKAWAFRQVQDFQDAIKTLKSDTASRAIIITSIEQEMESVKQLRDRNQDEIARITRILNETKERCDKENGALNSKLDALQESRESELDGMKTNALDLSRKETGLIRFQAIVDYYSEGDAV